MGEPKYDYTVAAFLWFSALSCCMYHEEFFCGSFKWVEQMIRAVLLIFIKFARNKDGCWSLLIRNLIKRLVLQLFGSGV